MNRSNRRGSPANRRASPSMGVRAVAQSVDADRARRWAIITAFATFLAVLLARIGG